MNNIDSFIKGKRLSSEGILNRIPHDYICAPNIVNVYRDKYISKKIFHSNPIPLYISDNTNAYKDPISSLVTSKHNWELNINSFKKYHQNVKTKLPINEHNVKNVKKMPYYMQKLYEELDNDPDKYFEGVYNWYYTNGNLDNAIEENIQLISHVNGVNQNMLNISSFTKNLLTTKYTEMGSDSIFETKFNTNKIFTRQKYNISLKQLSICDNKISLRNVHLNSYKKPLTSFTFNEHWPHKYCTVDINRSLKIFDLNKNEVGQKIAMKDGSSKIDKWSLISYINNNLYYLDRETFSVVDPRQKVQFRKHLLLPCDYHSIITHSTLSDYNCYIGTYHSVIFIDLRNLKTIIKKWSHQLNSVPFVMKTVNFDDNEVLFVSTQLPRDRIAIVNSNHSEINNVPFLLPSLNDTLTKTKLNGSYLHPANVLCKRATYMTSGVHCLKYNYTKYLLTQNSLGDLHISTFDDSKVENMDFNKFEEDVKLNKIEKQNTLNVTHIVSMKHLNKKRQINKKVKSKRRDNPRNKVWKRDIRELQTFTDYLAPTILHAWGYTTEGELGGVVDLDKPKDLSYEKVSSWLSETPSQLVDLEQDVVMEPRCLRSNTTIANKSSANVTLSQNPHKRRRVSGF